MRKFKEVSIRNIVKEDDGTYTITANNGSNGFNLFEVNWRDVPRYNPDGSLMKPEEFMEKIVKKHGIIYFNQNYGCVEGSSIINIFDKDTGEYFEATIAEFEKLLN